jgi:hypothetical protein
MSYRAPCQAFVLASFVSASALAAPVTLEFDALSELEAGGFVNYKGGTTTASDGKLVVAGATFEEWALESGTGSWWQSTLANGWMVEANLRIVTADADCASTGFWVADNSGRVIKLQLSASWAGISYPASHGVEMDTTDAFHVYRLQYLGHDRYQFLVDGKLIRDVHQLDSGAGSTVLMFGDLGGCSGATSEWESFTYDPVPYAMVTGDADGDGIENELDLCATDADPSKNDEDGDGDGDVCDRCPNDADNDADGDAICGDDDACPLDPRNDQDEDGVCDTEQCSAVEALVAQCGHGVDCTDTLAACPAVCQCQPPFVGVDPAWSLDTGLLIPPPGTPGGVPLPATSSSVADMPGPAAPPASSDSSATPMSSAAPSGDLDKVVPTPEASGAPPSSASSTAEPSSDALPAPSITTAPRDVQSVDDSAEGGCSVAPGATWGARSSGWVGVWLALSLAMRRRRAR